MRNTICSLTEHNKKAIEELINLKKKYEIQAQYESDVGTRRLMDLLIEYPAWAKLNTAEAMENKFQELLPLINTTEETAVKFPDQAIMNEMLKDYAAIYCRPPYNYEAPTPGADPLSVVLHFPNEEEASNFDFDQAKKGREFIVIDIEGNIVACAKGGTLMNADGKPYERGEPMKPTDPPVSLDDFIKKGFPNQSELMSAPVKSA